MHDIQPEVFFSFFLFLFIPFLTSYVLNHFRIPPMIGYTIGGILMGSFFFNFISKQVVNDFAYFGIMILLFTIGLETRLERMFQLKKFIILGGALQLLLTMMATWALSIFFGFNFIQSFLLGVAFSSSSTSLVAKLLQNRNEESTFIGELAFGLLIFQDIAFIPFMIIYSSVQSPDVNFLTVSWEVITSIIKATIIIMVMIYLGKHLIPKIFSHLASRSREIFNLFIIIFIFLVSFISVKFDLPILVGIFVAGVIVSQTIEHHHIFSEIRPLRDLLVIVFFIFIGTHVEIGTIIPQILSILTYISLFLLIKILIILGIFLFFRFNTRIAFTLGMLLFQIDEDAFIFLSMAQANQIFTHDQYNFAIAVTIISLLMTPMLVQHKDRIYRAIRKLIKKYFRSLDRYIVQRVDGDRTVLDEIELHDHVVICGFGRLGSYVGSAMQLAKIPYIGIDYNFHVVQKARQEKIPIIYGDPSDSDILDYAQVDKAKILVIALTEKTLQEAIILHARRLNPDIIIITRVHNPTLHVYFRDLGSDVTIQPEVEASLSVIRKIYRLHDLPTVESSQYLREFRRRHRLSHVNT